MREMTNNDLVRFRAAVRLRDRCVDAAVAQHANAGLTPSQQYARATYDAIAEMIRADERERLTRTPHVAEPSRVTPADGGDPSLGPSAMRDGGMFRDVVLPADNTEEHTLLTDVRDLINAEAGFNLIGAKPVWALLKAIREERPDGGVDPDDKAMLEAIAVRAGMRYGAIRFRMAYLVVKALQARASGGGR